MMLCSARPVPLPRQPILLNFVTGKKSELGRKAIHVAHGAIMFIAWGVLLPLGILVGRFAKNVKPDVRGMPVLQRSMSIAV
jgi:hypothetical protein